MSVEHLEILVEEPSAEAFLRQFLPKFLGDVLTFEIYIHRGKQDLLRKLPNRLSGYARWLPLTTRIIVLLDRDGDDCRKLKARLEGIAAGVGLQTTMTSSKEWRLANRLAIEELEAWFLGDWAAVRKAYPRVSPIHAGKTAYRYPDEIAGGTWEALERVLQSANYFLGGLRKVELARTMGNLLSPASNTSPSFRTFTRLLEECRDGAPTI